MFGPYYFGDFLVRWTRGGGGYWGNHQPPAGMGRFFYAPPVGDCPALLTGAVLIWAHEHAMERSPEELKRYLTTFVSATTALGFLTACIMILDVFHFLGFKRVVGWVHLLPPLFFTVTLLLSPHIAKSAFSIGAILLAYCIYGAIENIHVCV